MIETSPGIVWEAQSPLGQAVTLKQHTLYTHIIQDRKRTEFIGEENTLKDVVEHPRYVIPDKDYKDTRHVYCDLRYISALDSIYWVQVVVDHSIQPNDVATAIACRTIPRLETENIYYDSQTKTDL